jgi:hypothetical protein
MNYADEQFQNDPRVQAAIRHCGNVGSGFEVGRPGRIINKTVYGVFWAFLVGIAVSAALILCGL